MRFTIDRSVFYAALKSVNRAIPTKPLYQLSDCIVFEFDSAGNLVLAGSDSMSTIIVRREIPMVEDTAGRVVIPAAPLLEFVKALPDGGVLIDASARVAVLSAGKVKLVLNLADSALYPQLPQPEILPAEQWHEFPVNSLLDALKTVAPATPDDLSRQNLAMVSVQKTGSGVTLQACDGMRMHQLVNESLPLPAFNLFVLTVDNLIKVLAASTYETGKLWVGETGIAVQLGTDYAVLQSPVVDFPDVTKSLLHPTLANEWGLSIDRDQLRAAIDRTRVVADDDTKAVHLALTKDLLTIRTKNSMGSYATETLPIKWDYADMKLVFRYSHLLDVLKIYPGATCLIHIADPKTSGQAPVRIACHEVKFDAVISQLKVELL